MNGIKALFHSSVGKKLVMAVTGVGLILFLIGHLLGNLQIFLPPEAINRYAHFLQSTPELLWSARLGMLVIVVLHVWSAFRLWHENRAARPVAYAMDPVARTASLASRTMILSGLVVVAFVVYHLMHFTVRLEGINGTPVAFHQLRDVRTGHDDVFAMVIAGFSVWQVSLFYIVGIGLLCLHLSHGVGAMFQSLGLMNRVYRRWIDRFAKGLALVLFCGYVSIPVAVLSGYGRAHLAEAVAQAQAAGSQDPMGK